MARRLRSAALAAVLVLGVTAANAASSVNPQTGTDSHLPVPRFVSLKAEGVNGRRGPGLDHKIDWIYERAGLPLQVTGESGPWRRVRDPGGAQVWIHKMNLEERRTAMIQAQGDIPLRQRPSENARPVAVLAPGVIGGFTGCDGEWRRITIGGRVGWAPKEALWGAESCADL
ncbi:MAG: SH3 domain-containing protein [Caulobacterales bacterium]